VSEPWLDEKRGWGLLPLAPREPALCLDSWALAGRPKRGADKASSGRPLVRENLWWARCFRESARGGGKRGPTLACGALRGCLVLAMAGDNKGDDLMAPKLRSSKRHAPAPEKVRS
jgi:hypothetical protein